MPPHQPVPVANEALVPSALWWPSRDDRTPRPWKDSDDKPTRKPTIPPEQSEAFIRTAKAVASATADIAHEVLGVAKDVLEFAPVPGLGKAVDLVLAIWDQCQAVESNRLACLRLTERAAEILTTVRSEVIAAGNDVVEVLDAPLGALASSFEKVLNFLQKQVQRPFIKRYLKREDDLRKVEQLEQTMHDALNLFSVAIQTRLLRHVKRIEQTLASSSILGLDFNAMSSSSITLTPTPNQATPKASPPTLTAAIQHSPLFNADADRALTDAARDRADFDARIRDALARGSDIALFTLLEVSHDELPEAQAALRRALEGMVTNAPPETPSEPAAQFDFDREFLEQSIDALARLSDYRPVPSWSVTKFEVDREERIGQGTFGEVFKGKWRGETVAIKILSPVTPSNIFKREIEIWRLLKHRHVLPIWGASSPAGGAPYFFLSPYMPNGALPQYLKRQRPEADERLRFMYEIALGMEYLHSREVLHGDMKAANVLVDGQGICLIADFGQSDVRNQVLQLSGQVPPHGTLRWLAPEIIDGEGELSASVDTYAFAICCVEITTLGDVPWARIDDFAVRNLVVNLDKRPTLPRTQDAEVIEPLIKRWWARDPLQRPPFSLITAELDLPISTSHTGFGDEDPPKTPMASYRPRSFLSPPLQPIEIPMVDPASQVTMIEESDWTSATATGSSYHSAVTHVISRSASVASSVSEAGTVDNHSSRTSTSGSTETHNSDDSREHGSPPPVNEDAAFRRDERRYRLLLLHDHHPSLKLPLWQPKHVKLGAVGFLDKSHGSFVTLLNAFEPRATGDGLLRNLPPMSRYGVPSIGHQRLQAARPLASAQRTPWSLLSSLSFLSSRRTTRHTTRLHAHRKEAFLFTEACVYRYLEDIDAPRAWFVRHIDTILEEHGRLHRLQREDIFLIVGTLDAEDWALFVSHASNGGLLHLNVRSEQARRPGQPWATFVQEVPTMSADGARAGPSYPDDELATVSSHRISSTEETQRDPEAWDSVLLARLRFRPDSDKPTSS